LPARPLEALGWSARFEEGFAPYAGDGLVPARVAVQHRGATHQPHGAGAPPSADAAQGGTQDSAPGATDPLALVAGRTDAGETKSETIRVVVNGTGPVEGMARLESTRGGVVEVPFSIRP
jgi:hypothetical protein